MESSYCWMCDAELPPGPDFCSWHCEAYWEALQRLEVLIAIGLGARVKVTTEIKCSI